MHGIADFLAVCFPSLFSIVDPFAAVPVYLALVGSAPRPVQRSVAVRAVMTLLIILSVFAAGGTVIFHFFGITIPAFKIAGGVILFGVAFEMLQAKRSAVRATEEETHQEEGHDVAIVPLGVPLLSGPGAIATAMMWSSRVSSLGERVALFLSIGAVGFITFLSLWFASGVARFFGKTGLKVATRIMGLILAATAVQFVINGVAEAIRGS